MTKFSESLTSLGLWVLHDFINLKLTHKNLQINAHQHNKRLVDKIKIHMKELSHMYLM